METDEMDRLIEALARLQAEPNGPSELLRIAASWVAETQEGRVPRLARDDGVWLCEAQAFRGYEAGRGEVRDVWHPQESGSDKEDVMRWRRLEEGVGAHLFLAFVKSPPPVNLLKCDWPACGSFFTANRPKRFCGPSCRNKAWHRAKAIKTHLPEMRSQRSDLERQCSSENRELASMAPEDIEALGARLQNCHDEIESLEEELRTLGSAEDDDKGDE